MAIINKWTVSAAVISVGTALSAWGDDGIAGCFNKDGRAYFMMDDGTLSADPIRNLSMGDTECVISHGGGSAPDVYPRVDIPQSNYAQNLVSEAADYSDLKWQLVQPETVAHPFEMFTAIIDADGQYTIEDTSGEPATGVLASQFSESVMPISLGDPANPALPEDVLGSVVLAYKTDEGISVARVPAEIIPTFE